MTKYCKSLQLGMSYFSHIKTALEIEPLQLIENHMFTYKNNFIFESAKNRLVSI